MPVPGERRPFGGNQDALRDLGGLASQLRRHMPAHGVLPPSQYFLIATPEKITDRDSGASAEAPLVKPWDVRVERDRAVEYAIRVAAELRSRRLIPDGPAALRDRPTKFRAGSVRSRPPANRMPPIWWNY
ncbi:MAG TPA: hypothetical protein VMB03_11845 [Bryobacteraceae bacterium]|nr:hypothetical protein [Bryobacteraceae bacterium]